MIYIIISILIISCSYPGMPRYSDSYRIQRGKASYYSDDLHGKPTASGEPYHRLQLTAAHRTLPFGTICKVTNLANGKSVNVRINDRGPFIEGRIIDLSYKAAEVLDAIKAGIIDVKVQIMKYGKR